jgi:hypothetical protein
LEKHGAPPWGFPPMFFHGSRFRGIVETPLRRFLSVPVMCSGEYPRLCRGCLVRLLGAGVVAGWGEGVMVAKKLGGAALWGEI